MPEAEAPRRPGRLPYLLLSLILFLASAYFYQDPEWNGNSRLDLTRAVVEEGTVAIDAYQSLPQWDTNDKAFYNGHYYSDKAIGSSLLAIPFYFGLLKLSALFGAALTSTFTKHVLTTIVMGSSFTACGLAMYWIAERLTGDAWRAVIPTLAVAFGTMLWPYSAVYYGHVPAAAFLIVAFALLMAVGEGSERAASARLFAAGLTAGLAFITDYTTALIIAGLLAFALYKQRGAGPAGLARHAAIALAGAALPLAVALAYNAHVYGSALATGYAYEVENRFAEGMSQGILGIGRPSRSTIYHITIDPQIGILWQSPILLLAPIGYVVALRSSRFRAEGLLALYAALAMLAMNGGYYLWWGGSAFGPRLLIPALPFLIVPLALLPDVMLWVLGALGILSSAQMLMPLMGKIQPTLFAYRPRREMFYVDNAPFTGFSLLYNYEVPQIIRRAQAGQPSWTLGAALGLPYVLSAPALLLAEALLLGAFKRTTRGHPKVQDESSGASPSEGSPADPTKASAKS